MKIEKFNDLISWQKAKVLTLNTYKIFGSNRDFGFRDQTQRASVSIMNNIAEGFERRTNKELRPFFLYRKRVLWRSTFHVNFSSRFEVHISRGVPE